MHDMGHAESELYRTILWSTRGNLIDAIKTNGDEKTFWSKIDCNRLHDPVFVSETHLDLWSVLDMMPVIDEVVNVDAHHDCWPTRGKRGEEIGCDSWGTAWLKKRRKNRMTWLRPTHEIVGLGGVDPKAQEKLDNVYWDDVDQTDLLAKPFDFVFICRSGCWTPPWLDDKWFDFLKGVGDRRLMPTREGAWSGMERRWTPELEAQARADAEQLRRKMEEFRKGQQEATQAQV